MVLLGQNVSSDIEIDWDQIPKGISRFLRNNGWLDILEIIVKNNTILKFMFDNRLLTKLSNWDTLLLYSWWITWYQSWTTNKLDQTKMFNYVTLPLTYWRTFLLFYRRMKMKKSPQRLPMMSLNPQRLQSTILKRLLHPVWVWKMNPVYWNKPLSKAKMTKITLGKFPFLSLVHFCEAWTM